MLTPAPNIRPSKLINTVLNESLIVKVTLNIHKPSILKIIFKGSWFFLKKSVGSA
jgi:hypothetical protein